MAKSIFIINNDTLHQMIKVLHKASKRYADWKSTNSPQYKPWIFPEQITMPRISIEQVVYY